MRVIAGKAKGTKLASVKGLATRPTSDRVKEALFNIIDWKNPRKLVPRSVRGQRSHGSGGAEQRC